MHPAMPPAPRLPGLSGLTEVGRGGFGVVYRAWQDELRRPVAVKVLTTRLDADAANRFSRECSALGAVSGHPHIVAVHAAGTTAERMPYLVMPYHESGSLADRLRTTGPLPWQEVLDIGVRLSGALQTAHNSRILHRDIKPANVLVDNYRSPRLADFGLARSADAEPSNNGVLTTPSYAAPEILRGAPAGPAADVYSLAATLFALLIGRGPFSGPDGENVAAVLYRALSDPPENLRGRGVPDPVCRVLEWGLAKDPRQRPAGAAAFGAALQAAQRTLGLRVTEQVVAGEAATVSVATAPVPGRPSARRGRRRWIALATVAVLVAAGGTFAGLKLSGALGTQRDPATLLLSAGDYGIPGLRADPSLRTGFEQLFGSVEQPRATDLASCLQLPVQSIAHWQHSAVYSTGPAIGETPTPQRFASGQSAGLVMDDEQHARAMVEQWNTAGFDLCQPQLIGAGVSLMTGKESPQLQQIAVTPLPRPSTTVPFAGKRVDVPLSVPGAASASAAHVYVDFMVISSGTAVSMSIVEYFPSTPPPAIGRATVAALSGRLTG